MNEFKFLIKCIKVQIIFFVPDRSSVTQLIIQKTLYRSLGKSLFSLLVTAERCVFTFYMFRRE